MAFAAYAQQGTPTNIPSYHGNQWLYSKVDSAVYLKTDYSLYPTKLFTRMARYAELTAWIPSLQSLTAANSTLNLTTGYNGSVARTIGINLANPNLWVGKQSFIMTGPQARFGFDNTTYYWDVSVANTTGNITFSSQSNSATATFGANNLVFGNVGNSNLAVNSAQGTASTSAAGFTYGSPTMQYRVKLGQGLTSGAALDNTTYTGFLVPEAALGSPPTGTAFGGFGGTIFAPLLTTTAGSETNSAAALFINRNTANATNIYSIWGIGGRARMDSLQTKRFYVDGTFGTALQSLRNNAANTGLEWYTPPTSTDYITTNSSQTGLTGDKTTSGIWNYTGSYLQLSGASGVMPIRWNNGSGGIMNMQPTSFSGTTNIYWGPFSGSALVYPGTIGPNIGKIAKYDANGNLDYANVLTTTGYTVATLPAGNIGDTAYVTDATAPTYLGALTGGGSVVCPVFYNGTIWVSH